MKKKLCILLAITLITINLAACGKTEKQDIVELEGVSIELVHSDKPAAEGEFGTSEEFSGIYAIRGYHVSGDIIGYRLFELTLQGIDNNNSGDFDASKTSIPNYILDYKEYVYLNLVFDDSGLAAWSVIDKVSLVDLGHPTVEQIKKLSPDVRYEKVVAGVLPDLILLSEYEVNKMYVFDLPTDIEENYIVPEIVNDSDKTIMIALSRVGTEEYFEKEWKSNSYISGSSNFTAIDSLDDKYYLLIHESSIELALKEIDYLNLSTCMKGERIKFDFEDFLYNDTDKVFTISRGEKTYVVNPGELVECSWQGEVMVDNIE